jgi:hypothetical protein
VDKVSQIYRGRSVNARLILIRQVRRSIGHTGRAARPTDNPGSMWWKTINTMTTRTTATSKMNIATRKMITSRRKMNNGRSKKTSLKTNTARRGCFTTRRRWTSTKMTKTRMLNTVRKRCNTERSKMSSKGISNRQDYRVSAMDGCLRVDLGY